MMSGATSSRVATRFGPQQLFRMSLMGELMKSGAGSRDLWRAPKRENEEVSKLTKIIRICSCSAPAMKQSPLESGKAV